MGRWGAAGGLSERESQGAGAGRRFYEKCRDAIREERLDSREREVRRRVGEPRSLCLLNTFIKDRDYLAKLPGEEFVFLFLMLQKSHTYAWCLKT